MGRYHAICVDERMAADPAENLKWSREVTRMCAGEQGAEAAGAVVEDLGLLTTPQVGSRSLSSSIPPPSHARHPRPFCPLPFYIDSSPARPYCSLASFAAVAGWHQGAGADRAGGGRRCTGQCSGATRACRAARRTTMPTSPPPSATWSPPPPPTARPPPPPPRSPRSSRCVLRAMCAAAFEQVSAMCVKGPVSLARPHVDM